MRGAHAKTERWDLWFPGLFLLAHAVVTHEVKVFTFGILLADTMTLGVLPDVAFLAGNAVGAVVEVLAVHATDRAVKDPLIFFFGQLVEFLLSSLHLQLEVPFRHAPFALLGIL